HRTGNRTGPRRKNSRSDGLRGGQEDGIDPPLRQRGRASESQPEISDSDGAGAADHAASSSRRVSCHAADQPDGARNRARGLRKRDTRGQHRDSAPQYSQHLYVGRTARGTWTAAHHATGGQPLALNILAGVRLEPFPFRENRNGGSASLFDAFSSREQV